MFIVAPSLPVRSHFNIILVHYGDLVLERMSYAKLTSACLTGSVPLMKGHEHRHTLFDDDDWQSPQPLKQLRPPLNVAEGVSAFNKSAKV